MADGSPPAVDATVLLEALGHPAALLDANGTVVQTNAAWRKARAVPPLTFLQAATGDDLVAELPKQAAAPELSAAWLAVAHGEDTVAVAEVKVQEANPRRWLEFEVRQLMGDARASYFVQLRDVTRRAKVEEQLRLSRSKLRSVIAGAPIALLGLDKDGVFNVVEGVGASGLGATPELLIGRSAFEVYAHLPSLLECVRGAMAGQTLVAAVPVGRMTYELRFSPALDEHGGVKGVVGVATDITERTRIEQMKNEFVSIVSHELRTPLTAIRGALGLLEGGVAGELAPRGQELVRIARSNSERLIRLINDILDLDKLEAGRLEFHSQAIEMSELLSQCAEELAAVAHDNGVTLRVEAPGSYPVLGDRDRLLQVLVNLTSNALKFAPTDSEVVLAASKLASGRLRFEVRDGGPGIAPEQRERLFKKFQQLDTEPTRASGGSGLGLAISKAIVDAHSGRIDVESELGHGSTFFFELPERGSKLARPPRARAEGLRGRTVEIDVGGIPNPLDQPLEHRVASLVSAIALILEQPSRARFVEAHAEASILRATMGGDSEARHGHALARFIETTARAIAGELEPEAAVAAMHEALDYWSAVEGSN